jgi:hypothetical protein
MTVKTGDPGVEACRNGARLIVPAAAEIEHFLTFQVGAQIWKLALKVSERFERDFASRNGLRVRGVVVRTTPGGSLQNAASIFSVIIGYGYRCSAASYPE